MHPRLYRLIEKHQRIDEALRIAQQRRWADLAEIKRLQDLKSRAKDLIHHFTLRAATA